MENADVRSAWSFIRQMPVIRRAVETPLPRPMPADDTAAHDAASAMQDIADAHRFPQERKGRNVKAGNLRGWHIEFGRLLEDARGFPDYQMARAACGDQTLVGEARLLNLYLIVKFALPAMAGDVIEFGTYKGGSALFLASLLKSTGQRKVLYGCDTFEGMPETNKDIDMHSAGDFGDASYDAIMARARSFGLERHLVLVKGRFEDTLPDLQRGKQFSLAHVDCDIHDAICFVLGRIDGNLLPGAYVVFDDPLFSSCLGAMEAVEQVYIQGRGLFAEQAYPHLVFRPKGIGR
jgi:hypothetical protein